MRKALVLLLALVFVGALGYAQGAPTVAINGFVETGVAAFLPGASGATNYWTQYNNDSGNAGRLRLGIAITSPDGNAGFVSRLEGDSGVIGNPGNNSSAGAFPLFFNRFAGWGKLLGGAITIKGGILDTTQFWTANRNWGGWLDGAAGLEVQVNAYPGLTVSYYLPAPVPATFAGAVLSGAALGFAPTFYAGGGGNQLLEVLQGSSIQANYMMANTVNIVAGYHFFAAVSPAVQSQTGYFWAGVDYLAIPNVTARVEFQALNIGNTGVNAAGPAADGAGGTGGQYNVFLEGAYTMAPLKIDVAAWIDLYAASSSAIGFDLEPNVSYDLGYAKVGVVGDIGNTLTPYNPINNAAGYGGLSAQPGQNSPKMNLDIGPYINVPITTGASVNAGFLYTVGDLSNDTGTSNGAAIYLDVRYSF